MLKKGFTLAEVLITLMIIGVVATLTTPALVKNVGSSKIGPQLSKFVNTWDTAVETLLMDESASNLYDAGGATFDNHLLQKLSKYMIMTSLKNNSGQYKIVTPDGTVYTQRAYSSDRIWQLKDGTIIFITQDRVPNGSFYSIDHRATSFLTVDIGGIKGSHRIGKEVFGFVVEPTGMLIPYGSVFHRSHYPYDLKAQCNQASTSADDLFACTGEAADNGWKATW